MLTIEDALQAILQAGEKIEESESLPLQQSLNRVLAQDLFADIDVPPAANSAMDGYALSAAVLKTVPTTLSVSQRIPAGSAPQNHSSGTAARIFTGGVIPAGADAVVMQEDCEPSEDGLSVLIKHRVKPGENLRPQGQDVKKGAQLFTAGHCLRPQDLALIASVGIAEVSCVRKPRVALLGTGDELVEPGQPLKSGQIYNSNKFMLAAMIEKLGCEVKVHSGSVADKLETTVQALQQAAVNCDLIISTGGVSVGEEDYIKPAMAQLGEISNWKIKLKPGKPLAFGRIGHTLMLGLPGNPVSSFVTFLLFTAPLLRLMQGLQKHRVSARIYPLGFDLDKPRQRPEYLRVRIEGGKAQKFTNQSSGVLASTVWADALALIPEDCCLSEGDDVEVFFLNELMSQQLN